jgi:uncharacterized membrane protein (DUF2068 family)
MKAKRPLIITLLSVFLMFVGFTGLLVLLSNGYSTEHLDYLASQCGVTGAVVRHFGMTGWNAEAASFSLIAAIIGVGLWHLSPWARTATVVVSGLEICSGIALVVEMRYTRSCSSVDLTSAFLGAVLILYFSRKKINQIFRPTLANVPTSPSHPESPTP